MINDIKYIEKHKFNNKMKNSEYTTQRKKEFSFRSSQLIDHATLPKQYRSSLSKEQKDQNVQPNDQFRPYVSNHLDRERQIQNQLLKFSRRTESYRDIQMRNRFISGEQFQFLSQQHLVEVEKLLLEISRLHDLCYDLEKTKAIEIQKVKDEFQHQLYSHISTLKQNQTNKMEILESQVKKYKDLFQRKVQQCKQIQKNIDRQSQNLLSENQRLKNQIKHLIRKKTDEVYEVQTNKDKEIEKVLKQNQSKISQMKEFYSQEMDKIKKVLNQKGKEIQKLYDQKNSVNKQQQKMIQRWNEEKANLQQRLNASINQSNQRYKNQKKRLEQILEHQVQQTQKTAEMQIELLRQEIQRLMDLMMLKDQQNTKITAFYQSQSLTHQLQINRHINQNNLLIQKLKSCQIQSLKEAQILKVKMASLHEADIKELMMLYSTKIQGLSAEKHRAEEERNRIHNFIQQQMHKRYQMKKKYDIAISKLNGKLLTVKTGMQSLENEFKQKMDNERSLMLLTSKSFIKEAELKDNNVKFYEQQLKKLRQLLDLQTKELQHSQKNVEEKIKQAEEQLRLLSSKIVGIKTQNEQKELEYKKIIEQKDNQIRELNNLLISKRKDEKDENTLKLQQNINNLIQQLEEKNKEISNLNYGCKQLEKENIYIKGQLQQLKMDTEISQTQSKERYAKIAKQNLQQLKNLYQRRLEQLEADKLELQKINTIQTEKITDLVIKYNEVENALRIITKQNQRLSELEQKIIHLGTDNNLVKNMAQLFRN